MNRLQVICYNALRFSFSLPGGLVLQVCARRNISTSKSVLWKPSIIFEEPVKKQGRDQPSVKNRHFLDSTSEETCISFNFVVISLHTYIIVNVLSLLNWSLRLKES